MDKVDHRISTAKAKLPRLHTHEESGQIVISGANGHLRLYFNVSFAEMAQLQTSH